MWESPIWKTMELRDEQESNVRKSFCKNPFNSAYLWSWARTKSKTKQNYFSLTDHQLAENPILVFGFHERTKKRWIWICNKICRTYSYDHFHEKICLKVVVNSFLHSVFFTDHLKHRILNQATCRAPSANPPQVWTHQLKSSPTAMIIFWGFQNFLIYLAKYFDHF